MGCTSAKPKRTTSIEDVASKQPQNPSQVPDKNGQVNKTPSGEEKILREKAKGETHAIEIPGAHKSFMAPDGIPFIDEDVESEIEDVQFTGNQLVNANDSRNVKLGSPDQNKNVTIVANKEVNLSTANPTAVAGVRSSALQEKVSPGDADRVGVNIGHHEEHRKETVTFEPTVISEIKIQEIQITTTKNQQNETTEIRSRTVVTDVKPKTDEEIAATKIQAGIRGYLDRQKVKNIRANKQHPTEAEEKHDDDHTQQHSGPKVTEHVVVEEHLELHSDDLQDPKLDAAATKIQANYKGYRTRKEIKDTLTK